MPEKLEHLEFIQETRNIISVTFDINSKLKAKYKPILLGYIQKIKKVIKNE